MRRSERSILDSIGDTPLVRLWRVTDSPCAAVYAKLEAANPSGSVKDRAALAMVEDAEARGLLKPGATLVEPSSGNMGISLAMVAAAKGYQLTVTVPENVPMERRRLLGRYGAEVHLTPSTSGMGGAVQGAQELAQRPAHIFLDQFRNPANPRIHRETTAQEIVRQTGGGVHALVAGVGTGGTITGVGQALKERDASTLVVAVEPAGSPMLSKGYAGSHSIVGLGPDFVPPILERGIIDEVIGVTEEEAWAMMLRLAREEGVLVGISSGACAVAALTIARRLGPGKTVVAVFADGGERYLGTSP